MQRNREKLACVYFLRPNFWGRLMNSSIIRIILVPVCEARRALTKASSIEGATYTLVFAQSGH
jgi:hypothetical protein